MQVEYATDLLFRSQAVLKPLCEQLSRQAILCVKAEHGATFLGRKITPQLAQEIGSRFATRIEGTCVKHRFAKSSIKIYDKFALVLRIETTTNTSPLSSTTARSRIRRVQRSTPSLASKGTSTASPTSVTSYWVATAAISNTSPVWTTSRLGSGQSTVSPNLASSKAVSSEVSTSSAAPNRPYFQPYSVPPSTSLAPAAPTSCQSSPATLTRRLARLRQLGVIKRVTGTYRYYLTRAGRAAIPAGRRLIENNIIPALADKSSHTLQTLRL
jgi:hypothetical protein